ncbi:hypothetical protein MLD38_034423 [Melastoma candidum]|uniref:Uncharacterized protein n=1 Tax=Melastoma candidum TaxID=119954 RepID=A0ACB9M9I3_9MYRT|nr:hypothetical protein MLD38_034423 [Melastoma candidum]
MDAIAPEYPHPLDRHFPPFVRRDVYGTLGRGDLPLPEVVLLTIAAATLLPLRLIIGTSIAVFYYFLCRVCTHGVEPRRVVGSEGSVQEDYSNLRGWRRTVMVEVGRFLSRVMLFLLGFYWIEGRSLAGTVRELNHEQSEGDGRPGAIVCNHVSYIDVLYHMSSTFPSFVAKRSVAKLPIAGLVSKCLGCIYVRREWKSSDSGGVADLVAERVQEAQMDKEAPLVMLFPEGTTTNGDFLLPFRTGAFLSGVPVLPVIIRYPYERFSLAWESISGVRHLALLLCQFVNRIDVTYLPVYYSSQREKDDPKLYASNVRRLMAEEGGLMLSDLGLPEKRTYLSALRG